MSLTDKTLRTLTGQRLAFTQPIQLRMDEIATGIRADVAMKLFGDDFDQLVTGGSREMSRAVGRAARAAFQIHDIHVAF